MGVYKKAIITDAGEALRARAVAGEANMQFSCAKTSTYVYPEGADLTKLTDLQEIRQTVVPSNVQITNDTLISVRSLFGNEQISEAYLIQNVGVYATDGENEILFAVCQAITPDQMPAYDGVAPSSFIYNVQLTVSQAAQISLVVNTAGTATTQDVLELEQKKVNGNGGDISETVIAATEKSQAEYPVPAAGDSAKTILGKVQKFFGDLRNWMTGVCLLGQIVNNCVTDNAKLPLSAAQGKVLMDLYNVLNTNQKNTAPKNHASTANTYGLGSASAYGHVKLSDSYTNSAGAASNGVAASSKAIVDCRNNIMSDIENTYAGISATLNSSVCSSGNIWGCRSGRVVMITFYLQLTGTFKTYTSYKIGTLSKQIDDVDMRSIAMDQDTGHAHIISCTAGSKDLTLDVKGETPLKAGNWIWGQITAFTHQK